MKKFLQRRPLRRASLQEYQFQSLLRTHDHCTSQTKSCHIAPECASYEFVVKVDHALRMGTWTPVTSLKGLIAGSLVCFAQLLGAVIRKSKLPCLKTSRRYMGAFFQSVFLLSAMALKMMSIILIGGLPFNGSQKANHRNRYFVCHFLVCCFRSRQKGGNIYRITNIRITNQANNYRVH